MFDGMTLEVLQDDGTECCTVHFVDNLTIDNVPEYVNENCRVGLTEYPGLRYRGWYVLMHVDTHDSSLYYTEILTPKEAYDYLKSRGRQDLIDEYDIHYEVEREVL